MTLKKNHSLKQPLSFSFRGLTGFTLVEVLISLFVLAAIFSVSYANYRDFSRRKAIAAAANKLKGDINFAKQLAYASKKPESGCTVLDGYTVSIDSVNDRYNIQADCSNNSAVSIGRDSLDLGPNIDISTNINQFTFKVLGEGTTIVSPPSDPVIIRLSPKTNYPYAVQIEITSGGEIKDTEEALPNSPTPTNSNRPTNTPMPTPTVPSATNTPNPSPALTSGVASPTPTPRK